MSVCLYLRHAAPAPTNQPTLLHLHLHISIRIHPFTFLGPSWIHDRPNDGANTDFRLHARLSPADLCLKVVRLQSRHSPTSRSFASFSCILHLKAPISGYSASHRAYKTPPATALKGDSDCQSNTSRSDRYLSYCPEAAVAVPTLPIHASDIPPRPNHPPCERAGHDDEVEKRPGRLHLGVEG